MHDENIKLSYSYPHPYHELFRWEIQLLLLKIAIELVIKMREVTKPQKIIL